MSKTAIVYRHLEFEGLGCFAPVLADAGYTITCRQPALDDRHSSDADADLLVVLGGPIGAYEEQAYPFLKAEIAMIERRLAHRRPTIGICLGAQLMARALGARVAPGPGKEIGFAPIDLTDAGRASCLHVFEGEPVLHWHGDTFELPEGAVRLASTPLCPNQAFALGPNIIGFQFHPEGSGDSVEPWLIGHACELAQTGKDVAVLRAEHHAVTNGLQQRGKACLEGWLDGLAPV